MKVLMLGGSVFVGRHIVEECLRRGWTVTMLTRGRQPIPAFVNGRVEHVVADRRTAVGDFSGNWDAVIDTCGYRAAEVAVAADALVARTGRYAFISSASVYTDAAIVGDECTELALPPNSGVLDPSQAKGYGVSKVACEAVVRERFGDRALLIRPGLVVGPYDPSDRFGYWPMRMSRGGHILAPGHPDDPVQFVDARDHAVFVSSCLEDGRHGAFNVASPPTPIAEVIAQCTPAGAPDGVLHWVDSRLLRLNRVEPWTELPLWQGLHRLPSFATSHAVGAGLALRPIAETAAETFAWERERSAPFPRPSQLSAEREQQLLALYG